MGKKYSTLDGLRGVAAIAVVTFHAPRYFGWASIQSAYLAVDLFFCLSGFVIAHAYASRLSEGLSVPQFMALRIKRLYPMFLAGLIPSIAIYSWSMLFGRGDVGQAFWYLAPALLFLPSPLPGHLYPVNLPAWSLFYELVVNALYASMINRLSMRLLTGLICVSGVALVAFGLAYGSINYGGSWSEVHVALARVCYSFFAGVLIYRLRHRVRLRLHPLVPIGAFVLILCIAVPLGVGAALAIILVCNPVLVALGAATEPANPRFYLVAGGLSYGIYVLHVPILRVFREIMQRVPGGPFAPWSGIAFLVTVVIAAWLAERLFDRPIRGWLTARSHRQAL